ncbi:MAG: ABC transporter permease, partial [Romboutsia sp.]|nr:ABC transporter permease [Romboutsia sp.]
MPVIQLLILPMAADYEIKNINISVVDHDHSTYSQKLIDKIFASGYFQLNDYSNSFDESFQEFQHDNSDIIIEIPQNFEKDLLVESKSSLFLAANSINGVKASVGSAYLSSIIRNFNSEIQVDYIQTNNKLVSMQQIEVVNINWF